MSLDWVLVDPPLASAAADCVTRAFMNGDALSRALAVPTEEFGRFVRGLLDHSLVRGLTVAGRTTEGDLAAVGINTMLEDDHLPAEDLCPTMAPIFAFLAELSEPAVLTTTPGRRIGHLWMAAVAPEYRGHGLLRQLLRQRLENLRSHGADDFAVEATHPHNVHVLASLPGSVPLRTLAPRRFVFRGTSPFREVEGDCVCLRGDVRQALEHLSS